MNTIHKLPQEIYQKIKAGEVIEDPASIVRELLDNAIDAKATEIIIDITNGGLDSITVQDNGVGMNKADLYICFLEHTTSKIKSFDDIFNLKTNGFRGEALSSICRVAQMSILSGTKNNDIAEKILIENGEISQNLQTAHWQGTIFNITNLFYNLPVRKKFLKSSSRETTKIKKEIYQKALSYPKIGFKFISNTKTILNLHKNQELEERMLTLLKVKAPLHSLIFDHNDVKITGTITGIDQVFDSTSELYIYINHRPLQSKTIYGVLNRALSQLIPRNKYLGGCIYIFTDTKNIDPNVHPAKKEVKIYTEDTIARGLYNSIRSIFYNHQYKTFLDLPQSLSARHTLSSKLLSPPSPSLPIDSISLYHNPTSTEDHTNITDSNLVNENPSVLSSNDSSLKNRATSDSPTPKDPYNNPQDYKYIGTYNGTYWLIEKDNHMLLIDFHAAHERKRYEELKKKVAEKKIEIQPLLTPYISTLDTEEWNFIEDTLETWLELGFDIELLDDNHLLLRATPSFLQDNSIQEIINFIKQHYSNIFNTVDLQDSILKYTACRKSYMANDKVPLLEIYHLTKEIFERQFPLTCPHGRPFIFALDQKTIESYFLR